MVLDVRAEFQSHSRSSKRYRPGRRARTRYKNARMKHTTANTSNNPLKADAQSASVRSHTKKKARDMTRTTTPAIAHRRGNFSSQPFGATCNPIVYLELHRTVKCLLSRHGSCLEGPDYTSMTCGRERSSGGASMCRCFTYTRSPAWTGYMMRIPT